MGPILQQIHKFSTQQQKALAVLIDPDNTNELNCKQLVEKAVRCGTQLFFVGGSLIITDHLHQVIEWIRSVSPQHPIVLFPGSSLHIDTAADAILFLSLISGRNPDYLIGQQVLAAPILKRSRMEVLPTGYMLIDGGQPTTVNYISNTLPIPRNKTDIAVCTAMAGEMLGMRLIYMDAGSGALHPVPVEMVRRVRRAIDIPLIVGGGIRQASQALQLWQAGADVLVVGNALEKSPELIEQLAEACRTTNHQ